MTKYSEVNPWEGAFTRKVNLFVSGKPGVRDPLFILLPIQLKTAAESIGLTDEELKILSEELRISGVIKLE